MSLRSNLIKLGFDHPEMRKHLLPILASSPTSKRAGGGYLVPDENPTSAGPAYREGRLLMDYVAMLLREDEDEADPVFHLQQIIAHAKKMAPLMENLGSEQETVMAALRKYAKQKHNFR